MTGSIRKRGKSSWELRFDVPSANGERKQHYASFKGTRAEAKLELTRLLSERNQGTLVDPNKVTVADYVKRCLDCALAQSPKTIERYSELADRQIKPHLGHLQLQKLTADDVSAWHKKLIDSGLAPRTVLHAHRVLSLALDRAATTRPKLVSENVAKASRPPKVEETELEILEPEQVTAVLKALEGRTLYPIVFTAVRTGLRRGELLALEWRDIDLDAGTLRVERSLEETKAGLRVKPHKTRRGRRNIKLDADAVTVLRAHKVEQIKQRLLLGQGGQPTLVFGNLEGKHQKPNYISRDWRRFVTDKNLPKVGFHALRHTHVSILINLGIDILTISRRIGHSSASMTLDVYGHLMGGADAAAAKAMEGALK